MSSSSDGMIMIMMITMIMIIMMIMIIIKARMIIVTNLERGPAAAAAVA